MQIRFYSLSYPLLIRYPIRFSSVSIRFPIRFSSDTPSVFHPFLSAFLSASSSDNPHPFFIRFYPLSYPLLIRYPIRFSSVSIRFPIRFSSDTPSVFHPFLSAFLSASHPIPHPFFIRFYPLSYPLLIRYPIRFSSVSIRFIIRFSSDTPSVFHPFLSALSSASPSAYRPHSNCERHFHIERTFAPAHGNRKNPVAGIQQRRAHSVTSLPKTSTICCPFASSSVFAFASLFTTT